MVERLILYPPPELFSFLVLRHRSIALFFLAFFIILFALAILNSFLKPQFSVAQMNHMRLLGRINCKETVPAEGTEEVFVRIYNKI